MKGYGLNKCPIPKLWVKIGGKERRFEREHLLTIC